MKFLWGKGATVRLSVTKTQKFHIVPVLGISQINSKDRKRKKQKLTLKKKTYGFLKSAQDGSQIVSGTSIRRLQGAE